MDTRQFLEALWPSSGIYCLATPSPTGSWYHEIYKSIDEFIAGVAKRDRTNIFFCVHTLARRAVWNPEKKVHDPNKLRTNPDGDIVDGPLGAWEVRTHVNMKEAKCFFFDLDVDPAGGTPAHPKFKTRREALNALDQFLFVTRLPTPLVTSSGNGFHVYWLLTDTIASDVWRTHAASLYAVARREGLKVDSSRTTDQSSVLRVVGTRNVKPGKADTECEAFQEGVVTPTEDFLSQLTELLGSTPVPQQRVHQQSKRAAGNLGTTFNGPKQSLEAVSEVCEHVRDYVRDGYGEGGYVQMYNVAGGVISYLEDGNAIALKIGMRHPRATEADIERHTSTWQLEADGPASCATLDTKCGGDACARCPFSSLGHNPLIIARKLAEQRLLDAIPKPKPATPTQTVLTPLCEISYPYLRTDKGIIQKVYKKVKGQDEEVEVHEPLVDYDMFPTKKLMRTKSEGGFSEWAVTLPPHNKQRVFKVPNADMSETRALSLLLINEELNVPPSRMEKVKAMLIHYLRDVQNTIEADRQFDHLGWVDNTVTEFVLPTTVSNVDGTSKPCSLSAMAKATLDFVRTKGTIEGSIKAMQFYNKPNYLRHQFMILCGLAAPLFQATGHAGVMICATGESGGSKSTALHAAGSLWGDPDDYVINATNKGMTPLAQQEMIFTLSNLPVCFDEITKMDPSDLNDFVFQVSQRQRRKRLDNKGRPRENPVSWKSAPVLCTSNSSVYNLLSIENNAGTAGNMRVIEIEFPLQGTKDVVSADQFLFDTRAHHGHIGPEFLRLYISQREAMDEQVRETVKEMKLKYDVVGSERFWIAMIACVLVAGRLARNAGLLPYDVDAIVAWALNEQLPLLRSMVTTEKVEQSSAALLSAFLNDKNGQTLIMLPPSHDGKRYPLHEPHGAIVVEKDMDTQVAYVRHDEFRRWCQVRHKDGPRALRELATAQVVVDLSYRRALGQGTNYAVARCVCFVVNLNHKAIAADGVASKIVDLATKRTEKTNDRRRED